MRVFCTWTALKAHKQSASLKQSACEPPTIVADSEMNELNELATDSNGNGIMSANSSQMEYRIEHPIAMATISQGDSHAQRMRRNNSTFECKECGRLFVNKKTLSLHGIIHTNERPFECWLCHKV